jgi:hypothetical protein
LKAASDGALDYYLSESSPEKFIASKRQSLGAPSGEFQKNFVTSPNFSLSAFRSESTAAESVNTVRIRPPFACSGLRTTVAKKEDQ